MTALELHATGIQRLDDLSPVETRVARRDEAVTAEVVDDETLPAKASTTNAELAMYREQYRGIAQPFDEKVSAVLAKYREIDEVDVELKPDRDLAKAQPYLSHTKARDIFNEAFGYGGWAVEPVGQPKIYEDGKKVVVAREFRFYALGRYIRTVMGAGAYYSSNPNADMTDAYETAESEAIRRATKAFAIAQNLWNEDFRAAWKAKYAVQQKDSRGEVVWVKRRDTGFKSGAGRVSTPSSTTHESPAANESESASAAPPSNVRSASPADAPATGTSLMATIAPRAITKEWKEGAFVVDDNNDRWTFPTKLVRLAERAIADGSRLKVAYKKNKSYRNVDAAEIV